jgi:hypothetical protein
MTARRTRNFAAVCGAVRKYQRQIALSVGRESTLVPLAKLDEFSRLGVRPFLPLAR